LADLYQLEELEGWRLLARHLELTEGFSFIVVLAPDDQAVAYIRSRLPVLVGSPESVRRVTFDPSGPTGNLAEALLKLSPLPDSVRLVWIDADPIAPERIPERDEAWRNALARLNRYRNTLQASFRCTLALAGPVRLQTILREAAPDLSSIRSGVFRIEPAGSARSLRESSGSMTAEQIDPDGMGLPGDPAETLAEAERIRGKPGREILLAQLLHRAGRQAFRLLQWGLALKCLQEASALEEAHGGDPELRIQIANEIAVVLQTLAQWERAFHYSRKALEIAEAHFGQAHPTTAVALNNLAQLLLATNRPAEAEPLIRRALAIDERTSGNDHPNVASDLNGLASLLVATNRLAEAEPLIRRALAIDERSFGKDHPEVATDLNNLALLLQATNRLAEAEPLIRRALAIDERSFGADHPNVAIDLNNLAQLLQDTNRLAEAEPLMRRALAINERSFGNDHPNVATDLNNLAQLLKATSRLAEAEPLMRRALAIDERSFGADHPKVAVDLNNLAQLLKATNRLAGAEPLYRRSAGILADFGQRNGYEHPQFRSALANYERALKELGRSDTAIQTSLEHLGADT